MLICFRSSERIQIQSNTITSTNEIQMQIKIQIQYVQPVYESIEAGQFEIKNGSYSLHQSSPLSWIFKVYHFA